MKELTGRGQPPAELQAMPNQKYRDTETKHVWRRAPSGWVKCSFLHIDPLPAQKAAWTKVANIAGLSLEEWATETLNAAAAASLGQKTDKSFDIVFPGASKPTKAK